MPTKFLVFLGGGGGLGFFFEGGVEVPKFSFHGRGDFSDSRDEERIPHPPKNPVCRETSPSVSPREHLLEGSRDCSREGSKKGL